MRILLRPLILASLLIAATCDPGDIVVDENTTADRLGLLIDGGKAPGRAEHWLVIARFVTGDSVYATERRWSILRDSGAGDSHRISRVLIGETPHGYRVMDSILPLVPACYSLMISSGGRSTFIVDSTRRVRVVSSSGQWTPVYPACGGWGASSSVP